MKARQGSPAMSVTLRTSACGYHWVNSSRDDPLSGGEWRPVLYVLLSIAIAVVGFLCFAVLSDRKRRKRIEEMIARGGWCGRGGRGR